MPSKGVSGPAVFAASAGLFLVYVGLKGGNPLNELRKILAGDTPEPIPTTSGFTGLSASGGMDTSNPIPSGNVGLLAQSAAKYLGRPYVWGGTFANGEGGDCSGLVWRAMRDAGIPIARFTTTTILASKYVKAVSSPQTGDIVVWPGVHMGIVVNPGVMITSPHAGAVVRYENYSNRRTPVYLRIGYATITKIASSSVAGTRMIAQ